MKKRILAIALVCALAVCSIALAACDSSKTPTDPTVIADDKYVTMKVTGTTMDSLDEPCYVLSITNNFTEPIYVYSDFTSFTVDGNDAGYVFLAESLKPGASTEEGLLSFAGLASVDQLKNVKGTLCVCNDDTWEDYETISFQQ